MTLAARRQGAPLTSIGTLQVMLLLACSAQAVSSGGDNREPVLRGVRVLDLAGRSVSPFGKAPAKAHVFTFVSVKCPISNSYAPENRRLYDEFSPNGVVFKLVDPNRDESSDAIRRHLTEYDCPIEVLRARREELAKVGRVRVTTEEAVFVFKGGLSYRGRIDDRYVDFGKARPAAFENDLRAVRTAILGGISLTRRETRAIACYISDAT